MKCYVTVILILELVISFSSASSRHLPRVLPYAEGEQGVPVFGDCEFRVNGDLNDPAPLFARHDFYELIVPDPTDTVRLTNGELLDMFCPGAGFAAPFQNRTQLTVQCLQQKYFLVDNLIYPFANFSCAAWPSYTALRTGRQCNGGTDLVKVGFQLDDDGFLQTYDVCHNELTEVTRYVHHVLYPSSYDYQHGVARPSFVELDFYGGRDVNTKYTQVQQNITISEILGMDASPYFNYSEDRILARGHMIAKTDQIFGAAQMSTFLFINVAPQWQSFNGGNWERIETSVRKFVADRNLTVDCYTGTWGVSTLPDIDGIERELYLDFDENNNGLIPVPKLYFRVIIDRASREGIVLVGVNNPYVSLEQIQSDYTVCEDIGHQLSWVSWLKEDLHEGFSYACTVEDFTEVVKDLPLDDLHTNGILGLDNESSTTTEYPSTLSTVSTTEEPSTTSPSSPTEYPSTVSTVSTTEEPSTTSPSSPTEYPSTVSTVSTTEEPSTTSPSSPTEYPSTVSTVSTTEEPSTTSPSSPTEYPSTVSTVSTTEEPSTTSPVSSTEYPSTLSTVSTTEEPSTTPPESSTESSSTTAPTISTTAAPTTPPESSTESSSTASSSTATTGAPATPTTTPSPTPNPDQCYFSINGDLRDPAPLLTPQGALSWLLPTESGIYIVDDGSSIDLHCTAALATPFNRYTALTARCVGNQMYEAEGLNVEIGAFSCQTWPSYEAVRTGDPCEGGTELLQIGFNVAAGLLTQLELCYDEQAQITPYARYELTPANVAYQRNVAQPGYLRADFYAGKDVNVFYSQSHQLEALSDILGLDASQYLDSSRDFYLTRGQLAARQDFVHGSAQRATHFYVNAVPQWRSINIGNWLAVERSLRQFVANEALNVSVHSGSWGVSTLPNAAGEQTPIYLDASAQQLPVPRLVYRIVIDQLSRKGIALVVANNPHASLAEILQDYVVCEDVGAQLDWLDWDKAQLEKGYAYACSVEDFTAVVKDLPLDQLHTTGLLGVTEFDEEQPQQLCNFRVNGDLKDPAPLFVLRDAQGTPQYLQPNTQGLVELKHGEAVELHCSGSSSFQGQFADYARLNASCWQQESFLVLGSVYQINDFVCTSWPSYTARRTNRQCNGGTNLLEVGFQLANNDEHDDFLQTYDVCHNELEEVTRYVHHVLTPSSAQYQRSVSRPSFITGDFYGGKDVNGKYTQVQQNITISEILGMDASPYFNVSGNVYLARGHLSAKTDYIFGAAQQASFFFVNAAPQWQTFNAGNWERIEDSVRKFVADENITVDCYTGTWGVSTLPDAEGVPHELYLDFDVNNNGLIPVPALYFRVIIDRDSRKGIVLLGVNNPHISLQEIQEEYIICPDIGDQISWISWTKEDLKKGYSYACTVEDFIEVVKDLPLESLQTNGILGIST
ncbi:uncharacterized protein Dvir_GJ13976 [Drosophila virilis]|uniref:DNA/RNA non-specific endonuclease domain-containing protein n=1 Tax=Drosophila virilis TaxID=7244 RepID=B4LBI3_DROVI|nr:uncharacterized protein Dvir_GJ13976 [Drosophila virilis]